MKNSRITSMVMAGALICAAGAFGVPVSAANQQGVRNSVYFRNLFEQKSVIEGYDTNKDGRVNVMDMICLKKYILNGDTAELNEVEAYNANTIEYALAKADELLAENFPAILLNRTAVEVDVPKGTDGKISSTVVVTVKSEKPFSADEIDKMLMFNSKSDMDVSLDKETKNYYYGSIDAGETFTSLRLYYYAVEPLSDTCGKLYFGGILPVKSDNFTVEADTVEDGAVAEAYRYFRETKYGLDVMAFIKDIHVSKTSTADEDGIQRLVNIVRLDMQHTLSTRITDSILMLEDRDMKNACYELAEEGRATQIVLLIIEDNGKYYLQAVSVAEAGTETSAN